MKEKMKNSVITLVENKILQKLCLRLIIGVLVTFAAFFFNTFVLKFENKVIEYVVIFVLYAIYLLDSFKLKKQSIESTMLIAIYIFTGIRISNMIEYPGGLNLVIRFVYALAIFVIVAFITTIKNKKRRHISVAIPIFLAALIGGNTLIKVSMNFIYVIFVFDGIDAIINKEEYDEERRKKLIKENKESKEDEDKAKDLDSPLAIYIWLMFIVFTP